jgi:hypothetical protein
MLPNSVPYIAHRYKAFTHYLLYYIQYTKFNDFYCISNDPFTLPLLRIVNRPALKDKIHIV